MTLSLLKHKLVSDLCSLDALCLVLYMNYSALSPQEPHAVGGNMPLTSPFYRLANRGRRWEGTGPMVFSSCELEAGFEHNLRLLGMGCKAACHLPSPISFIPTLGSLTPRVFISSFFFFNFDNFIV